MLLPASGRQIQGNSILIYRVRLELPEFQGLMPDDCLTRARPGCRIGRQSVGCLKTGRECVGVGAGV